MKNLFLDTNVVIDVLDKREPFSTEAALLFEFAEKEAISIFIAAVSFNVIYYVLRRKIGHKITLTVLDELTRFVTIVNVTQEVIKDAITSGNSDFEDAIQYYSAISNTKIEAIITRDPKGFKKSKLPIFKPTEVLELLVRK